RPGLLNRPNQLFSGHVETGQCLSLLRSHDLQGHGVRSSACALSMLKIPATMTLIGRGYMAHICICFNLNKKPANMLLHILTGLMHG
ncbi:hypothetical protein, partial [Yersinia intermedia]|uniref:hypothetical protein n=1 Tax=Yersinia intermedia TaxID=631 RepID=UPI000A820D94